MSDLKWYHYPEQYGRLLTEVREHEMIVLHDHDGYRHLRFKKPGTGFWHFDLITWPGSLAIRGDIGEGFLFTREHDMLTWFDHGQPDGHINAQYWAEKLDRGARRAKEFSTGRFSAWLRDNGQSEVRRGMLMLAANGAETIDQAVDVLDYYNIDWNMDDPELWLDYEYHFILALHAILWGAKKYHAERGDA